MRYFKLGVAVSALTGLVVLDHREHKHTRQKIDELAASVVAKAETPPPVAPPLANTASVREIPREEIPRLPLEIIAPPSREMPRERITKLPQVSTTLTPYVIDAPDQLIIEAVVRDSKMNTISRLPVQPLSGTFLVRPDGTVSLGHWGSVRVAGLTIQEATDAVQKHLAETITWKTEAVSSEPPVVVLNVVAKNSKRYYIIATVDGDEQVYAQPQTGTETVFDALTGINGLSAVATAGRVYVKRKTSTGEQILPVDWSAITQRGVVTTNYQLLAGDKVFVTYGK